MYDNVINATLSVAIPLPRTYIFIKIVLLKCMSLLSRVSDICGPKFIDFGGRRDKQVVSLMTTSAAFTCLQMTLDVKRKWWPNSPFLPLMRALQNGDASRLLLLLLLLSTYLP